MQVGTQAQAQAQAAILRQQLKEMFAQAETFAQWQGLARANILRVSIRREGGPQDPPRPQTARPGPFEFKHDFEGAPTIEDVVKMYKLSIAKGVVSGRPAPPHWRHVKIGRTVYTGECEIALASEPPAMVNSAEFNQASTPYAAPDTVRIKIDRFRSGPRGPEHAIGIDLANRIIATF